MFEPTEYTPYFGKAGADTVRPRTDAERIKKLNKDIFTYSVYIIHLEELLPNVILKLKTSGNIDGGVHQGASQGGIKRGKGGLECLSIRTVIIF